MTVSEAIKLMSDCRLRLSQVNYNLQPEHAKCFSHGYLVRLLQEKQSLKDQIIEYDDIIERNRLYSGISQTIGK